MFYSHTFLARKGPLGTVWCAAHLQHKLKKSHYTSTHIPSTVERIMCPEVPLALRMSGHLLLGVVRIYSKKVDYLHHDCNLLWLTLRNSFRLLNDVDLPHNSLLAPVSSVTLPETYQLDALEINADFRFEEDHHLKSQQEITLQDQNPVERELYIRITLDDDFTPNMSRSEASPAKENNEPMQIDIIPSQVPSPDGFVNRDNGISNQSGEIHERFGDESSIPDIPNEIEIMRDCPKNDIPIPLPDETLVPVPNTSLHKTTEKELDTPSIERQHMLPPEMLLHPSPHHSGPSSPPSNGAPDFSGSFVNATQKDFALRATPTPEKPKRQLRKRKQLFDESLVLTNEFVKNALNDCSNLVKKRKKLPCASLDMWRFMNIKKKEHIFSEPLISGICSDLLNLPNKDLISLKLDSRTQESPASVPIGGVAEPLRSPVHDHVPDFDEPELLRSPDHGVGYSFGPVLASSPLRLTVPDSHEIAHNFSSPRFHGFSGSVSAGINTDPHGNMFSSRTDSCMETPVADSDVRIDDRHTVLSDIPELKNSMALDELSILESDDGSPYDSMMPREGDTMSRRTSVVAKYLRDLSPVSPFSERPAENLSLNSILEGRSRKVCARMFYETLILKVRGVIDVQQAEPYGDITLKWTPKFSTAKV